MRLDSVHVGVDVDGVLAANLPTICRELREWKDIDFYPEDVSGWNAPIPGLDMHIGEAMDQLTRDPTVLRAMDPVDGACNGMQALQDAGATVTIITHRRRENHDVTKQWLADHDIPYDSFADEVGPDTDKSTVGVDVHIDDYHQNLVHIADAGGHGIMMLRHGNLDSIPDRDCIHVAGGEAYDYETLLHNRALQWAAIPDLIHQLTVDRSLSD